MTTPLSDPTNVQFELVDEEPGFTEAEAVAFLAGADTSTFGVPKISTAAFWRPSDHPKSPVDGRFIETVSFADRLKDAVSGKSVRAQVDASTGVADKVMTSAEKNRLQDYTTGLFNRINGGLRKSRGKVKKIEGIPNTGPTEVGNTKSLQATVEVMDTVMTRSPLKSDVVVLRGVTNPQVTFGNRWSDDVSGLQWTEHAFSSTTDSDAVARQFAGSDGVILRMLVPKGTGAIHNSESFGEGAQNEYILERNLRYHVIRDHGVVDGVRTLDVEVTREKS